MHIFFQGFLTIFAFCTRLIPIFMIQQQSKDVYQLRKKCWKFNRKTLWRTVVKNSSKKRKKSLVQKNKHFFPVFSWYLILPSHNFMPLWMLLLKRKYCASRWTIIWSNTGLAWVYFGREKCWIMVKFCFICTKNAKTMGASNSRRNFS